MPMTKNATKPNLPEVLTSPETPTLAETIKKLSVGMEKLLASGLNRRATLVLLAHDTGISQRDIKLVLDGLQDLAKNYTK